MEIWQAYFIKFVAIANDYVLELIVTLIENNQKKSNNNLRKTTTGN